MNMHFDTPVLVHKTEPIVKTILVVEKYAALCEVIATVLRRCGYHVLTATGGEQAREIAHQPGGIDLLLAAIEVPETCAPDALGWFRAAHPETEVIFMSSDHAEYWPDSGDHIERPFIYLDALIRKVCAVLNRDHAVGSTELAA